MARHHPRREDHRHADAVLGQLEVERLRQPEHRELRRLVRAEAARGAEHRRRRGEHEMRVRRPAQQREERPGDARGADHVHVEHPRPCFVAELLDRAELLDADVGEHQVGASEPFVDRGRGGDDLRHVADVGVQADLTAPCALVRARRPRSTRLRRRHRGGPRRSRVRVQRSASARPNPEPPPVTTATPVVVGDVSVMASATRREVRAQTRSA